MRKNSIATAMYMAIATIGANSATISAQQLIATIYCRLRFKALSSLPANSSTSISGVFAAELTIQFSVIDVASRSKP